MQTTQFIWHNGKLVPWNDAKVHVLTHTLHYGGGAFEGIRFYQTSQGSAIFRLPEHIDRLLFSASILKMNVPFSKEQLISAVRETVRINGLQEGYIRPLVYYGSGIMGVNPTGAPVELAIACWPWGAYLGHDMVDIKISKYVRIHPRSSVPEAKLCGHYVNSILVRLEIQGTHYHEGLLLDTEGNVAEGSGENFFIVKEGVLHTPKIGGILPGITRKTIMEIASKHNIKTIERDIKPDEVYTADEAFFTGTAAEVTPIRSIDDKVLGQGEKVGPITDKLRQAYLKVVQGKDDNFLKYLTFI
jgi:branched-chain amino acid aminotransferase